MQSKLIKQYLRVMAIILMVSACNEQYSGVGEEATSKNSTSQSSKSYSSAGAMRWSTNGLGNTGLNVHLSEEILAELNPSEYVNDLNPIQQMLEQWNSAVSTKTLFNISAASDTSTLNEGQKADLLDYNDNVFGIYRHDTWFPDVSSSALAITQFFGKRVNVGTDYEYLELIHADIIVNYKNFTFGISNKSLDDYDLSSVILHELGHFLGLGHSGYYDDSVMVPYLDVGTEKREILNYDMDSISNLYESERSTSAVVVTSALTTGKSTNKESKPKAEIVQGIIELQASGKCNHYIDGKLVHQHKKKPGQFRPGFQ